MAAEAHLIFAELDEVSAKFLVAPLVIVLFTQQGMVFLPKKQIPFHSIPYSISSEGAQMLWPDRCVCVYVLRLCVCS